MTVIGGEVGFFEQQAALLPARRLKGWLHVGSHIAEYSVGASGKDRGQRLVPRGAVAGV